jgi:hypothetical protein
LALTKKLVHFVQAFRDKKESKGTMRVSRGLKWLGFQDNWLMLLGRMTPSQRGSRGSRFGWQGCDGVGKVEQALGRRQDAARNFVPNLFPLFGFHGDIEGFIGLIAD